MILVTYMPNDNIMVCKIVIQNEMNGEYINDSDVMENLGDNEDDE